MVKFKLMIPYFIILFFSFYLLPFFIKDTGSGMFVLLIVLPVVCLMVSFIYGLKNSFNLLFSLFVMLLFAPTIFIFYNKSAAIYIFVYGLISLFGNFIGDLIRKNK